MNEPCWHPDLLRRFVATPYIFLKGEGLNRIYVESNDLEIALSVRNFFPQPRENRAGGLFCRLIRDSNGPVSGTEISIITDGALRVLHLGQETVLIHDVERSELLGFVSPSVEVYTLVSSLIPALLKLQLDGRVDLPPFTKK
jgi:hypothetical protein